LLRSNPGAGGQAVPSCFTSTRRIPRSAAIARASAINACAISALGAIGPAMKLKES